MIDDSPVQTMKVSGDIQLDLIKEEHAPSLFELVNNNRQHLRQWLPWVDNMQSVDNMIGYIRLCQQQHNAGSDLGYTIKLNGEMAGRIGIHYISPLNRSGAIGYWLAERFTGGGIITKACTALISYCFEHLNLHRIEIKCATGNQKSAAIAERLGFKKEGVLREAEWVNGVFADLTLYSVLRKEWNR